MLAVCFFYGFRAILWWLFFVLRQVDSMDTLWLAGEKEEFARCLRWVTSDMDLNVDQVRRLLLSFSICRYIRS